jgi:hypothetical protein
MVKRSVNKKEKEIADKTGQLFDIKDTDLGKSAKKFLALREQIDKAKGELEKEGIALVELMNSDKKDRITIDGVTLSIKITMARVTIAIKKAKDTE